MLHKVTLRSLAIALCGGLLACDAGALTLGRVRGAAVIGQPLELSVPATLDAPDADGACASGELFYGEQKVPRAPVVRWQPAGGAQGTLRISSPVPVDEPTVSLTLRVGCSRTTTRRYDLLADLPAASEQTYPGTRAAPAAPAAPATSQGPSRAPAAATTAPARARAAAATTSPRRAPASGLRTERALGGRASATAAAPASRAPRKRPETAARLRLEPLDLGVDRDPVLRLSPELASQANGDLQQRQAAAALWAALQKSPEDTMQEAGRVQALQRDLAALRETTRQNAAAVGEMRAQVERAQANRHNASWLVSVLSAVLVALLVWLGWRWYRAREVERVGQWFEQHGDTARVSLAAAPATAAGAAAASPAETTAPAPAAPGEDFQASRGGTVRMVGVEELIDVHEKADFFIAIGEFEQAMAVLDAHVHDRVETSALAWMDLLDLYHAQGKRVEYERLRAEFLQRFTVDVPDYEHFDQPTASLENYGRALSRIVALWPSPKVLDVIEESIFRKPGLPGAEPFSLEAYRDLVLLYHVAREVAEEPRREAGPTGFPDTSLQPLNMAERPELADRERLLIPPKSARLGVDIDLADPGAQEQAATDFELELPGGDAQPAPAASKPGHLPVVDFDVSAFDEAAEAAARKRG